MSDHAQSNPSPAGNPTPVTESANIGTTRDIARLFHALANRGYFVDPNLLDHNVVSISREEHFPIIADDIVDALERALNWAQTGGDE